MADTQLYRGDDSIAVSDELGEAMTARGWATTPKKGAEEPVPTAGQDKTPEGTTDKKGK